MRLHRYLWLVSLIFAFAFSPAVRAAAVPVQVGHMNAAVGDLVKFKTSKWGFAANDPRVAGTLAAVATGLTAVVTTAAIGGVAALTWPAMLAIAGSTAVSFALPIAVDAVVKWTFNSDGTISTSGSTSTSSTGATAPGTGVMSTPGQPDMLVSGGPFVCPGAYCSDAQNIYSVRNCNSSYCELWIQNYDQFGNDMGFNNTGATITQAWLQSGAISPLTPQAVPNNVTNGTPAAVIANLPEAELDKKVSDAMLAKAANDAWRLSNGLHPEGLASPLGDPITPGDVAQWRADNAGRANPLPEPTGRDLISPLAPPASSGSTSTPPVTLAPPSPAASPVPSPGPAATPGTGPAVDLGTDPNVTAPNLERTPTALEILNPITSLMPDIKNFAVPAHGAECPKSPFTAFGQVYLIESHCTLLESNRAIIEAALLLVWTLTAAFIVLRA